MVEVTDVALTPDLASKYQVRDNGNVFALDVKVGNGAFDMRDHFVVDRRTLLPLHMDSRRGVTRTDVPDDPAHVASLAVRRC